MKSLFILSLFLVGYSTAATSTPAATDIPSPVTVDPASCTKYDRIPLFGTWTKKNCRDTRARLLVTTSSVPTTGECTIDSGSWIDSYTDSVFTSAGDLQIDHLVPLKEAYESGAYTWTYAYTNDSSLLLVASKHQNTSKGAKDVAEWLPPHNVQAYCLKWASVKRKYNLSADSLELETLRKYVPETEVPTLAPEVTCRGE